MDELTNKVTEPIVAKGSIKWKKEEITKKVNEIVASYKGVVYTEDSLQQAKKDRAELNTLKKALVDRRRKVKNIMLEPYEIFESEVNEVVELIDTQAKEIDATIKSFEEEEKLQKKKKIEDFYEESIGDLKSVLPFEDLFKDTYLNKSVSMKKIKTEMLDVINSTVSDLEVIDTSTSKYKINAKDVYLRTRDLKRAMNEIARLEEFNKRMAEAEAKKRAEEEARRKAEEEAKAKAEEEAKRRAEENARLAAEAEARRLAEEEARAKAEAQAKIEAERAKAEADRLAAEEALRAAEEERIRAEEQAKAEVEAARAEAERIAAEAALQAKDEARLATEAKMVDSVDENPVPVIPPAKPGEKVFKAKIQLEGTEAQILAIGKLLSCKNIKFMNL